MALTVASIGLPLAVIGASYLCWYKTDQQTFWSWTCDRDRTQVDDNPEIEFRMVCGEVVSSVPFQRAYISNIRLAPAEIRVYDGLDGCCGGVIDIHQCPCGVRCG